MTQKINYDNNNFESLVMDAFGLEKPTLKVELEDTEFLPVAVENSFDNDCGGDAGAPPAIAVENSFDNDCGGDAGAPPSITVENSFDNDCSGGNGAPPEPPVAID